MELFAGNFSVVSASSLTNITIITNHSQHPHLTMSDYGKVCPSLLPTDSLPSLTITYTQKRKPQVRTLSTKSGDLSISIVEYVIPFPRPMIACSSSRLPSDTNSKGLHVLSLKYKSPTTGLISDVMVGSDDPVKQLKDRRVSYPSCLSSHFNLELT